jgi:hypothetical protein
MSSSPVSEPHVCTEERHDYQSVGCIASTDVSAHGSSAGLRFCHRTHPKKGVSYPKQIRCGLVYV